MDKLLKSFYKKKITQTFSSSSNNKPMTSKQIKLNLGCGPSYKPGFINIDNSKDTVADEISDVANLANTDNSVDLIEADQLVEHFDFIHLKYVLSEWFRVLKPHGVLIVETPDLRKSIEKLIEADYQNQISTLSWIYGIDSPGMRHSSGFNYELILQLLKEIGFANIKKEKPLTHCYEPGLRIVCQKPSDCVEKQLLCRFRKSLEERLGIDDSYFLIPLENQLKRVFTKDFILPPISGNKINNIIARLTVIHPEAARVFLEECFNLELVDRAKVKRQLEYLDYLNKIEFSSKMFTLWKKSKKEVGLFKKEYDNFLQRLETLITEIFKEKINHQERLQFIADLEPGNLKIFELNLLLEKARKEFNFGVKYYYRREYAQAVVSFDESRSIIPDNPLVYWNLARLGQLLAHAKSQIAENYQQSLNLLRNRKLKGQLTEEFDSFTKEQRDGIDLIPISETINL